MFDEPGSTPYVVRGPENPEALVVIGPSATDKDFRRSREFAEQLTSSDASLAVAIPAAVADADDDAFQVRRMATELHAEYTRSGQDLLIGLVSPEEMGPWGNAGVPNLRGVYVLGPLDPESRERSLGNLMPLTDFTDNPPSNGNQLVQRLAAARDAQERSTQWSGLVDDLRSAVERGESLPRPAELPSGVVWAERSPAMPDWEYETISHEPAGILERARAMSSLPIQGLVTDGQQVTGVYTHGVPANSQLTQVMIGKHIPDVYFGSMAFDGIGSNIRGAATIDTAIVRPLGPLKGWEKEFGAALGGLLPREGAHSLLITPSEGYEAQAASVVAGVLAERPDYGARVGLMVESRFTLPTRLMLMERLGQLSIDNDVTVLNFGEYAGDLADVHRRIGGRSNQNEAPEPSPQQSPRKLFGLTRRVGGPTKSTARRPGGPAGR